MVESQRDILPAGAGGRGLGMRPESKKVGMGCEVFKGPSPQGPEPVKSCPRCVGYPVPSVLSPPAKALGRNAGDHKLGGKKRKKGHRKSHAPSTTLYSVGTRAPRFETPQRVRGATPSLKQTCFPEAILVEKRQLLCCVERCPPRPCECDLTWK